MTVRKCHKMRPRKSALAIAAATLALAACSATEVHHSDWGKSPNGQWESRLVERDTSGPGSNYLYKDVEVRRIGADEGVRVVTIDEGQGTSKVRLHWKDQTNLDVTYEAAPLLFQVLTISKASDRVTG